MSPVPVCASLDEFDDFICESLEAFGVPSIAYGISRGTETLRLGAIGYADKERKIAATTQTPYSLASVTKPMTATAVAILAGRGLLHLDDSICDYLEGSAVEAKVGDVREATIRRVANHTSGLPLHYQFFYEDEPYLPPPMAETIRRYGKLFDAPGERYRYSNIGYGILDYLVELVSGKPYSRFMAEEVFEALGMENASIGVAGGEAISYGMDGAGYPRYGFDHPGASAAYASVEDLLKFGQCHLGHGPRLLSDGMRLEMQRPTAIAAGTAGYGVGWGINEDSLGIRTVSHSGGMSGVNTILTLVPDHDLVVAMLVNTQSPLPFQAAENCVGALIPAYRERLIMKRAETAPQDEPEGVPAELFGCWNGKIETYSGDVEWVLDIRGPFEASASYRGETFPVNDLAMKGALLTGNFEGQIPTPDASRRRHRIHMELTRRGEALCGAAGAVSSFEGEGGGAPGNRRGNAVCHWTELSPAK